jgi:hypothetical protein
MDTKGRHEHPVLWGASNSRGTFGSFGGSGTEFDVTTSSFYPYSDIFSPTHSGPSSRRPFAPLCHTIKPRSGVRWRYYDHDEHSNNLSGGHGESYMRPSVIEY